MRINNTSAPDKNIYYKVFELFLWYELYHNVKLLIINFPETNADIKDYYGDKYLTLIN